MKNKNFTLFNEIVGNFREIQEGDKVKIQIMRKGKWKHPTYGEVIVDDSVIDGVIDNFNKNTRGIDIAIDENHEPNHRALGWVRELIKQDGIVNAMIELTKLGAELISKGTYKYFSPELIFEKKDEETGEIIKNLLIGGAFTNRPFFKGMNSLMANEDSNQDNDNNKNILFINFGNEMKTILELLTKYTTDGLLSQEDKDILKQSFEKLSEEDKTEELRKSVEEAIGIEVEEEKEEMKEEMKEEKKEIEGFKEKKIEANEKGDISISFSELENLKKLALQAKELLDEKKRFNICEKIKSLSFSENNKIGIILPKMTDEVTNFAFSLDEEQSTKFFSIIEKLQTVSFSEIGSDREGEKIDNDRIQFFMEKFHMTKDEAISASKY